MGRYNHVTQQFIAYLRVSTQKQGDSGLGLAAQRAIIDHYSQNGEVIEYVIEVGSGKSITGRPQLQAAVERCREYDYTLIVAKVDRLSRKTEDALDIYSQLNGRLIACDIPNLDKFTLTIFMAIADRERELISIRTRAALAAARQRGVTLGTTANMTTNGRRQGQQQNKANAISAYAQTVGYARLMQQQGLSLAQIADRLNAEGFKTRQNKQFHKMTVKRILDREDNEDSPEPHPTTSLSAN